MVHVAPSCRSSVTSPKLRKRMPKGAAKLDWKSWQSKDEFLLSEVSTRGPSHAASRERWRGAENAAQAFLATLTDLDRANDVTSDNVISLVRACHLRCRCCDGRWDFA